MPDRVRICIVPDGKLRESEGKHLTHEEREELSKLIGKYDNIFRPGEDQYSSIKHYIDTGNNLL